MSRTAKASRSQPTRTNGARHDPRLCVWLGSNARPSRHQLGPEMSAGGRTNVEKLVNTNDIGTRWTTGEDGP